MLLEINRLILVRHAMPAVLPDAPAEHWELDEQGRAASRALAAAVPTASYYVTSDEPKALQTVQEMAAGQEVTPEPGFREVRRPYRWSDDYRKQARAYVDGICPDGWEPHAEVVARFDASVRRHAGVAAARQQTLVIGTHGLAPTIWLASRLPLQPSPGDFWASLDFPDLIHVDLAAMRVQKNHNWASCKASGAADSSSRPLASATSSITWDSTADSGQAPGQIMAVDVGTTSRHQ